MPEPTPAILPYANDANLPLAQWRKPNRLSRIPPVFIALTIQFLLHLLFYLGLDNTLYQMDIDHLAIYTILAAISPILIQRRGWPILIASLAVLATLIALHLWSLNWSVDWQTKDGVRFAAAALALSDLWIYRRNNFSASRLFFLCILAFSLAMLLLASKDFLRLMALEQGRFFSTRIHTDVPYFPIYSSYIFLLQLWLGIPLINWASRRPTPPNFRAFAYTLAATLLIIGCLYFDLGRVWIANFSLLHGFPYDRYRSANLLYKHGGAQPQLWEALDHADWTKPDTYAEYPDWRAVIVDYLERSDPTAPRRFAAMLLAHPSHVMAHNAAHYFEHAKIYEAIPLLLRYALVTSDEDCTAVLFHMNIRQVAYPYLLNHIRLDAFAGKSIPLTDYDRAALKELLGVDAGDNPDDWDIPLQQHAHGPVPGIPPSITAEADEVISIYLDYQQAVILKNAIADHRASEAATREGLAAEFDRYAHLRAKYPFAAVDEITPATGRLFQLILQARESTTVPHPDWNVPTTAALRTEIQQFKIRISALEPPATNP